MPSTARLLQVFSKRHVQSVSTRRWWQPLLLVLLFTPHLDAALETIDPSNEIKNAQATLQQLQQDHHDGDNIVGTSFLRTQDSKSQRGSGMGTRRVGEGGDAGAGGASPTEGGSLEAKAKNQPQPPASAPDVAASSKKGTTAPVASAAASVPDLPSAATPPGDNGPKPVSKPTEDKASPPPSRKPTEAPVAKPTKPDSPPTVEPTKDAEKSPVKAPTKAPAPDPATDPAPKPEPTKAPVEAPKPEPTKAPVEAPKPVPVPAPVEPPVPPTTTTDDDDKCDFPNQGCTGCKKLAKTVNVENPDMTCRWEQDLESCRQIKKADADAASPVVCDGEPTAKPVKSPEAKPPTAPESSEVVVDEDEAGVGNMVPLAALGVLVLLIVICCYRRCCASSRSSPNTAMAHNPALGKYQGVRTTMSDDDDNEWGWDDTPKQPNLELSRMGSQNSATDARYRRGASPLSSFDSGPSSPRNERKGMSVKKMGMKNPLSAGTTTAASSAAATHHSMSHSTSRQKPIVKKMPVPKPDDFFAEMGLESKPTFPSTSTAARGGGAVKRLGATSMPMDDWGDDGDLDDLLDD